MYKMTAGEVERVLAADRRRIRRPVWDAVPERPWREPGVVVWRNSVVGGVRVQRTRKVVG
jgi:hypothetical protein